MRRSLHPKGAAHRSGFTLIELLVSIGVGSVVLLVLLQSFNQASDSWMGQSRKFSALREGRSGIRIVEDDLNSITALPLDPSVTTGVDSRQRFIYQPQGDDYGSARLAFLTFGKPQTVPGVQVADTGDVRLVMYLVAITQDSSNSTVGSNSSQKLWRKEFTPQDTYTRVQNAILNNSAVVEQADWDAFAHDPVAYGAEAVAYDVIRFAVDCYKDTQTGTQVVSSWPEQVVPVEVDITLRTTSRSTGSHLISKDDWQGRGVFAPKLTAGTPTDYTDDAETRTDTLRVRLVQAQSFTPPGTSSSSNLSANSP